MVVNGRTALIGSSEYRKVLINVIANDINIHYEQ